MSSPATADELMTVIASRALRDDDVCFVGIGAPSAACNLARATHAPGLVLIYESGTIQVRPEVLPLSIGDGELCDTALTTVSVPELFAYWLQSGRISKGFLGGAQIDRHGNINSTVIGDYHRPTVRLPGGGGAPEIAANCGEVYIIARHQPRVLVDTLDFITSYGHGSGGEARAATGLRTRGPTMVVTDLGILRPEPASRELVVTSLHPGVDRARIRDRTGWPVRFAADVEETAPPTSEELGILRALQERTRRAHGG